MTTTHKFWHWPDWTIGKRESRRLREEHNALGNSHAELLEALRELVDSLEADIGSSVDHSVDVSEPGHGPENCTLCKAKAALAKAEGV